MNQMNHHTISIQKTWHGWVYSIAAPDQCFTLRSKLSFASEIAATTMAHLDLLEIQLWQREKPGAFFSIETGEILSANAALWAWLGADPIGRRCDQLPAIDHFSTELLPVGDRVIGSFQILGNYKIHPGWNLRSPLQSLLRFKNFAKYSSISQQWLNYWANLPRLHDWEEIREVDKAMRQLWG